MQYRLKLEVRHQELNSEAKTGRKTEARSRKDGNAAMKPTIEDRIEMKEKEKENFKEIK